MVKLEKVGKKKFQVAMLSWVVPPTPISKNKKKWKGFGPCMGSKEPKEKRNQLTKKTPWEEGEKSKISCDQKKKKKSTEPAGETQTTVLPPTKTTPPHVPVRKKVQQHVQKIKWFFALKGPHFLNTIKNNKKYGVKLG